jgi:hypothetical protein
MAGWANQANTALDKHEREGSCVIDDEGAASAAADEATDVLADLSVTGRAALAKTSQSTGGASAAELAAAAATAPPGVLQGDGLNARKQHRMQRNTSTAELRVGEPAPGMFKRTTSESALSVHALKPGRPAPSKTTIGTSRSGQPKTVKVSIVPK